MKGKKTKKNYPYKKIYIFFIFGGKKIKKFNGKKEQFDKLQPMGYHIGSADILAYEENERVLLIDYDIGSVDPKKVKKS